MTDTAALTCGPMNALPGIRHGFFTRRGGVSEGLYTSLNCGYGSGDDAELVRENRFRVARALTAAPESLVTAYQIHSPICATVKAPWDPGGGPQADALVTATPGIALSVLTADCLPILMADGEARVIAAVHAGWKGAFGGVISAAVAAMEKLGARPERIHACIGPAIAQGSYEVGAEFHERFLAHNTDNQLYFIHGSRDGHFLFDLKAYAKEHLRGAGISAINLLAEDTCLQEDEFFSFRRATLRGESVYGRQISAIVMT